MSPKVDDLEGRCATKEAEFEAYRRQVSTQPESRLQAELSMAQLEKVILVKSGFCIMYVHVHALYIFSVNYMNMGDSSLKSSLRFLDCLARIRGEGANNWR